MKATNLPTDPSACSFFVVTQFLHFNYWVLVLCNNLNSKVQTNTDINYGLLQQHFLVDENNSPGLFKDSKIPRVIEIKIITRLTAWNP